MDDEAEEIPTVDKVFRDFLGRRAGIIRALTADVKEFVRQCNSEKDDLCLYGLVDGRWQVGLPASMLPTRLPEPALGINLARGEGVIQQKDWLSFIAVHSDAWLLSVAFANGAGHFDKAKRQRLFDMINDLPTVFDLLNGRYKATKVTEMLKDHYDETMNEEESFCGACEKKYEQGQFWIYCDFCETWFHNKCVNVTSREAAQMKKKKFKCPSCRVKDVWRR